ncbi:MAG: M56 family metallopeptidase [Patescibacteria group bacterium]
MKLGKHFLIFVSLLLILGTLVSMVIYKFIPLLVHHTIYYCQAIAHTLSFQMPENLGMIIFIIIYAVIFYTAIKFISTLLRIYRFRSYLQKNVFNHANLTPLLKNLNLINKVITIQNEKPFAFCFGIKSPKIYISTKLISLSTKSELQVILLHEQHHLEHRDAFTLLIAHTLESLFPFFPLLSDLILAYRTERELLADKAAINGNDRMHLISVFKKLLRYESATDSAFVPAIIDHHTLDARIRAVTQNRQYRHVFSLKNIFISLFSLSVILFFITVPVTALELHEGGRDVMILCSNTQGCNSYCKQTIFTPANSSSIH